MAIVEDWTPVDTLEASSGEARSADFNSALGNLAFLYGGPRVTLADTNDHGNIDDGVNEQLAFNTVLVEEPTDGWTGGATFNSSVTAPRDGLYGISWRIMWDAEEGGTLRRLRVLRDGDPIAGDTRYGHAFTEHSGTILSAMASGTTIGLDVRHNDTARQHAIKSDNTPVWRSPLLIVQWIGPLGTAF